MILLSSVFGCKPENDFDLGELAPPPKYFYECFCKPGGLYQMTAAYISPINEDFIWDLSYPFNITISTENDTYHLMQGIFRDAHGNYIYNYGSPKRLSEDYSGNLYIKIVTQEGDTVTGHTSTVSQVEIDYFEVNEGDVNIFFYGDNDENGNFYLGRVENWKGGLIKDSEEVMADLRPSSERVKMNIPNRSDKFESISELDSITVKLFHISEDNYHYLLSIEDAYKTNENNTSQPSGIKGNLKGGLGIFTYYTEDKRVYIP